MDENTGIQASDAGRTAPQMGGRHGSTELPSQPASAEVGWQWGLVGLAIPAAVIGGLAWWIASWAGSWMAPLVALGFLVGVLVVTPVAKRARGFTFLVATSLAVLAMASLYGGNSSPAYDNFSGTSDVSTQLVPGSAPSPAISEVIRDYGQIVCDRLEGGTSIPDLAAEMSAGGDVSELEAAAIMGAATAEHCPGAGQ